MTTCRPGIFCFPAFDCVGWAADPPNAVPVGTTELGFSFADCQSFLGARPVGAPWHQVRESFRPLFFSTLVLLPDRGMCGCTLMVPTRRRERAPLASQAFLLLLGGCSEAAGV